jgi:alkylation response protein AidB-like acyl-CoA dehydrogenase
MSVHLGLVAGSIQRWGTEAQKDDWLPRMATGQVLGCFGLTEPDHGSNPAGLRATAEARPGGGWRLNGRKVFITNGSIAGVALVMARTGGPGAKGISAFLVPTDRSGFTANPIHGKLGLRSCDTAELVLDDVEVGPDALLGQEGEGLKVALSALDDGRMSIAASCAGVSQAALEAMIGYAGSREQFGKPIAGHQLVQQMIADSAVDVDASRLLTWAVADLKARGERYSLAASKAKLFATEASVRVANACIQVHGGYGYVEDYPAAKYLRDARVTTLYEGTSQIQQLLIGRALTGVSAF